jgi:hypothetical protein
MKRHDCNFFYGKTIITDLRDGNVRMKYCPICGKILGANDALSIKELKKQIGKPVYIICEEFPDLNGWYVSHFDEQTKRVECWGYNNIKMDSISYGTWLAYLSER